MTSPQILRVMVLLAGLAPATAAIADDSWNPFRDRDRERADARKPGKAVEPERPAPLSPMDGVLPRPGQGPIGPSRPITDAPADPNALGGWRPPEPGPTAPLPAATWTNLPPPDEASRRTVERTDLSPVIAADGSGLPLDLWRGVDLGWVEASIAKLELPPRSPAVYQLWRRLLLAEAAPGGGAARFDALRMDLMYRTGLLADLKTLTARSTPSNESLPLLMHARSTIAVGQNVEGCALLAKLGNRKAEMAKPLRAESLLLDGYCAAQAKNTGAAGLSAELAREEGATSELALAALDAVASGQRAEIPISKRLSLLDYRYLQLGGTANPLQVIERADPAVLAEIAADPNTEIRLRITAGEAAAKLNTMSGAELAEIYRAFPIQISDFPDPLNAKVDASQRRAFLFRFVESERTPLKRSRLIRALLDEGRRAGLYLPMLQAVEKSTSELKMVAEIGWFAETAIEVMVVAGRYEDARRIAALAGGFDRTTSDGHGHWLALIDIADSALTGRRGESLASVEQLALRGRFRPDLLHRLATVLDALDYHVPIPLWDAANRTPQPTAGFLPETGVLSELQDASKRKEFGRTVLLTMRALAPQGAEGANLIALGDAMRALKRAGLEPDARRLGFEALFAGWPRAAAF